MTVRPLLRIILATVVTFATARGVAVGEESPLEMWQRIAAPGTHHKDLEVFVGRWDTVTRMWTAGPDAPPMESPGTSDVKWTMGGRFILHEHTGTLMGQPFLESGILGYDNYKNMFIGVWYNNMSTAIINMTGHHDPVGKTWSFYGTMDEPMLQVQDRTVRYVWEVTDHDHHVFTVYDLHAGEGYKVVEIRYSRGK